MASSAERRQRLLRTKTVEKSDTNKDIPQSIRRVITGSKSTPKTRAEAKRNVDNSITLLKEKGFDIGTEVAVDGTVAAIDAYTVLGDRVLIDTTDRVISPSDNALMMNRTGDGRVRSPSMRTAQNYTRETKKMAAIICKNGICETSTDPNKQKFLLMKGSGDMYYPNASSIPHPVVLLKDALDDPDKVAAEVKEASIMIMNALLDDKTKELEKVAITTSTLCDMSKSVAAANANATNTLFDMSKLVAAANANVCDVVPVTIAMLQQCILALNARKNDLETKDGQVRVQMRINQQQLATNPNDVALKERSVLLMGQTKIYQTGIQKEIELYNKYFTYIQQMLDLTSGVANIITSYKKNIQDLTSGIADIITSYKNTMQDLQNMPLNFKAIQDELKPICDMAQATYLQRLYDATPVVRQVQETVQVPGTALENVAVEQQYVTTQPVEIKEQVMVTRNVPAQQEVVQSRQVLMTRPVQSYQNVEVDIPVTSTTTQQFLRTRSVPAVQNVEVDVPVTSTTTQQVLRTRSVPGVQNVEVDVPVTTTRTDRVRRVRKVPAVQNVEVEVPVTTTQIDRVRRVRKVPAVQNVEIEEPITTYETRQRSRQVQTGTQRQYRDIERNEPLSIGRWREAAQVDYKDEPIFQTVVENYQVPITTTQRRVVQQPTTVDEEYFEEVQVPITTIQRQVVQQPTTVDEEYFEEVQVPVTTTERQIVQQPTTVQEQYYENVQVPVTTTERQIVQQPTTVQEQYYENVQVPVTTTQRQVVQQPITLQEQYYETVQDVTSVPITIQEQVPVTRSVIGEEEVVNTRTVIQQQQVPTLSPVQVSRTSTVLRKTPEQLQDEEDEEEEQEQSADEEEEEQEEEEQEDEEEEQEEEEEDD